MNTDDAVRKHRKEEDYEEKIHAGCGGMPFDFCISGGGRRYFCDPAVYARVFDN